MCGYLLNGKKEKISIDNNKNVHIIPFKILSNQLKEIAIEYIIEKHTQLVRYVAGNNRTYTKECIPKKKDISLYNLLQIFTLENDIHFELIGKKRFLSVTDNGTKDLFVNEDNISECEICNKPLNKLGILCDDCGTISHDKRFFNFISHGFYCNKCGKSICRNCASYFSKLLIFKTILCNNCSQQEIGRTIKKFKPTGLGRKNISV